MIVNMVRRSRHFRINTYYNKKTNNSYLINFFTYINEKGKITSNFCQVEKNMIVKIYQNVIICL